MKDIYKTITQEILASLKEGVAPWNKPWCSEIPKNAVTKRPYSGINVLVLWSALEKHQYKTSLWLTFKQAKDANLSVKKGEKGTRVVFVKSLNKKDDKNEHESDKNDKKVVFIMRSFVVFNLDQLTGDEEKLAALYPEHCKVDVDESLFSSARQCVENIGAEITQGVEACFYPQRDFISMPSMQSFYLTGQNNEVESQSNYYATLFHELVHWSGHESRLNRDLEGRFGESSYAAEELVAEMGSAFLCAQFGITGKLQHASYIKSWVKILENDDHAIFTAASKAQQAVDFLLEKEASLKIAVTS